MNGYVMAFGTCFSCRVPFSFNPHRVPSISIEGDRKPVCLNCMNVVNAKRKGMGLEPHPIMPDAYDAIPEHEL